MKQIEHVDENGLFHHDTEPAIIQTNGTRFWYQHGKEHRDNDLPAAIYANGDQYWYQYGEIHRDNGPALIHANGTQCWYQYGEFHRVDGPAVIRGNDQYWLQCGVFHRTTGPASIELRNGNIQLEYKINGVNLSHAPIFEISIYSCFPSDLINSPLFEFFQYDLTDPTELKTFVSTQIL